MKQSPFVFIAVVILGCLALAVVLAVFVEAVPALVVSVLLACSVATLLYGILGGVSEAGFNFGPIKMTGSAAVLLGCVWMFNSPLERQLTQIRYESRVEQFGFDFDEHATPSNGWFAIDESTGVPVEVAFTDPVTDEVVETVQRPTSSGVPLKLASEEGNDRYLVLGAGATTEQGIGYVSRERSDQRHGLNRLAVGDDIRPPSPSTSRRKVSCLRVWSDDGATRSAAARACHSRSRPSGFMDSPTTTSDVATLLRERRQTTPQASITTTVNGCVAHFGRRRLVN